MSEQDDRIIVPPMPSLRTTTSEPDERDIWDLLQELERATEASFRHARRAALLSILMLIVIIIHGIDMIWGIGMRDLWEGMGWRDRFWDSFELIVSVVGLLMLLALLVKLLVT